MAVSLREYRARIKSVESTKKITRAMELIAASRIIKAQQRAQSAAPYARELTRAVSAVASYSNVDHPLTTEPEDPKRAAVLVVTSDRGLAGAYSSGVLKEAEKLRTRLEEEGKKVDFYVSGRKGEAYFRFRNRPVVESWTGHSDQPSYDVAEAIGEALIGAFLNTEDTETTVEEGDHERTLHPGVDEVHVVFTQFRSMLVQEPRDVRLLPLEVVEGGRARREGRGAAALRVRADTGAGARRPAAEVRPEPDLLRAAAGGGLRARRPSAGDEVGDRQRRRADQQVQADRQPGSPGRHHPGNQ